MKFDNLASSDLNLLLTLKVLLDERNVTRAAGQLNLSQPAVSRSLSRLRQLFNDPLFTRGSKELEPTPRALAIAADLNKTLEMASQLIEPPQFDPEQSDASFRIAITDYCAQVLFPDVVQKVYSKAPNIRFELVPMEDQVLGDMAQSDIDLAIGVVNDAPANIKGRSLGNDHFVCVAGKNNPLMGNSLDIEKYTRLPHILMTMGGEPKGVIDHYLESYGLKRHISIRTPHFVAALAQVAKSHLLLTLPRCLANYFATYYDLIIFPLPLDIPGFEYSLLWHERHSREPAHKWLREIVSESMSETVAALNS